MPVPETAKNNATTPHVHEAGPHADEATCPYCGQPISRKQYRQIVARIEAEARGRVAEAEEAIKQRFARDMAQAEAKKKAEVAQARKDAVKTAETQIKTLKANQQTAFEQRLKAERETFEKKIVEAVNSERVKGFEERTKLDEKLQELQRRLQKNRSIDLGDEREIEIFEALHREFTGFGDNIVRLGKGKSGSDIHHLIFHHGTAVGKIIFETKNTSRWMNQYIAKLRRDQLAEQADHAVLVTTVFPAGMHEIGLMDGVIIAAPQRVVALAHLLRRVTVQMHLLRASSEVRAEKTQRLYRFLVSDRAARLWAQVSQATNEMIDLDRAETAAHQKTWLRRADLVNTVSASVGELLSQIDGIIEGAEASI